MTSKSGTKSKTSTASQSKPGERGAPPRTRGRRPQPTTPQPRFNLWTWVGIIGGAVVLVVLVSVLAFSVATETDVADSEFGVVDVQGDSLPILTDPGSDDAVGMTAPTVSSTDVDDNTITIAPDGRAKAIGFFAHWCPHCQEELPELSAYLNNNGLPPDMDIYAIATSSNRVRTNFPPSSWFESAAWPTNLLFDSNTSTIGDAFGVASFPFWVVLDENHQVLLRLGGRLSPELYDSFFSLTSDGGSDVPINPGESSPADTGG